MVFDPVRATSMQPTPLTQLRGGELKVSVDGRAVVVHETEVAWFFTCIAEHPVTVVITCEEPVKGACIRPLHSSPDAQCHEHHVAFTLDVPRNVSVEIDDLKPLFVFASPPCENRPTTGAPGVYYYGGGGVHEAGLIELRDNETLYVEEGTVLKAQVRASHAANIRIAGRGIIDGSLIRRERGASRMLLFEHCRNVCIEDVVLIHPVSWMVVVTCCDGVRICGIREIGICVGSDGIDVVGSRNVLIENTFQRNNDDCIVIKGASYEGASGDVENVLVRNCVLLNAQAGNVMEIGYETRCASIRNVSFRSIDVIGAHGEGGVFTVHNAEQAQVSDILYEDIRVEHFYDKLIDFRIFDSRYSRQERRGTIRNVVLRRIITAGDRYNTISLLGGYDAACDIRGVRIEDMTMGALPVRTPDELPLYTRHAADVVILQGAEAYRVC